MAANKVRVTEVLGMGNSLGEMDPKVGMETHKGPILTIASGSYTVSVGVGSGDTPQNFYTKDLFVTHTEATGNWSFPSGDGALVFGHSDSLFVGGDITNLAYVNGRGEAVTFTL